MKHLFMVLIFLSGSFLCPAQELKDPGLRLSAGSDPEIVISDCDEYCAWRQTGLVEFTTCSDHCEIDFSIYDLVGVRKGDHYTWALSQPKRYKTLDYKDVSSCLRSSDSPVYEWELIPNTDSLRREFPGCLPENDSSFTEIVLFHDLWLDCHGYYYYRIKLDPVRAECVIVPVRIYGGSAGMCPRTTALYIRVPLQNFRIRFQGP